MEKKALVLKLTSKRGDNIKMALGKKALRFGKDVIVSSVSLGVADRVSQQTGFSGGGQAVKTFGAFLPVYGNLQGVGIVIGEVRKLGKTTRRRRVKRRTGY